LGVWTDSDNERKLHKHRRSKRVTTGSIEIGRGLARRRKRRKREASIVGIERRVESAKYMKTIVKKGLLVMNELLRQDD